jgi:predicted AlkP superfamily pyrophosphatase or phosphodiesterase
LGKADSDDFYSALRFTPMGDELTLDFARQLVESESLGEDAVPDILAISLSATDYIGHAFGPNSLEAEDNLVRLDRSIAGFLDYIDQTVGLQHTLIVLTSDHGVDASPEYASSLGLAAGRHQPEQFIKSINATLKQQLDIDRDLVQSFWNPSLYLDWDVIRELQLDTASVERAVADAVLSLRGFAYAVTRTDLLAGRIARDPILEMVQRSFHPQRSGEVLVVQSPFWYLYPDATIFSAMHGSPYACDTYVPIMFAGAGLTPRVVERPVAPQDVACTITAFLGLQPPSGSTGRPLAEVLAGRHE